MHVSRPVGMLPRLAQVTLAAILLGTILVAISACGGNTTLQQQAYQSQVALDHLLQQAQAIGVPASQIKPVLDQKQQLIHGSAPFSFFSDQPYDSYYKNLNTRYVQLTTQLQGIITASTEQAQTQAQQDMQTFQTMLAQRRSQGFTVDYFTQQYDLDQSLMAAAKTPKDYAAISSKAGIAKQSLDLMLITSGKLATLKKTIDQMQNAHLDVTAMQTQYQNYQQDLTTAENPADFQKMLVMINASYQQAIVNSIQALPYVTAAKLNEFAQQIQLLKTYGMDPTPYQKKLDADNVRMSKTVSIQDYSSFAQQVDADLASMHNDLIQGEAGYLVKQFHKEVTAWGQAHLFHDKFDGQNYVLDSGYDQAGIGSDLDLALSWASTPDDYQAMVDEANNALFNLHMMEQDYNDPTPFDQVHATDMQLLNRYKLMGQQVIMVSLTEQALRLYQNGKLVRGFQVTTGRVELPSVPGVWSVMNRQSPTVFKSPDPKGSPFWYPDTPINYAILYHRGGYFIHDSWWRVNYGPGTQFPHYDTGGDEAFAGSGSHGCVNVQEQMAAWLYNTTNWNTIIVIY